MAKSYPKIKKKIKSPQSKRKPQRIAFKIFKDTKDKIKRIIKGLNKDNYFKVEILDFPVQFLRLKRY
jgi:hypothetical protein